MKFKIVVALLVSLCAVLVYLLLFGFRSDLEEARSKIQKESVESLTSKKKIESKPELKPYINRSLSEKAPVDQPAVVENHHPEKTDPPSMEPNESFEVSVGEKSYWCRNSPLLIETDPVKCLYPDSCYSCSGPIIPPEVDNAIPLCRDGTLSQVNHVECCPRLDGGRVLCPSLEACFKADEVPKDYCSCQDRPECRLVKIGEKIECLCTQDTK